jgi:hypothetical protein
MLIQVGLGLSELSATHRDFVISVGLRFVQPRYKIVANKEPTDALPSLGD